MRNILIILVCFSLYSCSDDLNEQINYYPSGKIKERTFVDEQKRTQGTGYTYFENGNIQAESEYSNGKLNGLYKEFYSNGKLKAKGHFQNGIEIDSTSVYFETGKLNMVFVYDEEGAQQKEISYYPNGNIKEEWALLVGKKQFVSGRKYTEAGNLIEDPLEGALGYANLKYSKSPKGNLVLKIDLKNNPYTDSLFLSVVKDFNFGLLGDPEIIRKISYSGSNSLAIEILDSDYKNDRLNMIVETLKYKDAAKNHSLIKRYYIQIPKKGKMPKNNVIGIYPK